MYHTLRRLFYCPLNHSAVCVFARPRPSLGGLAASLPPVFGGVGAGGMRASPAQFMRSPRPGAPRLDDFGLPRLIVLVYVSASILIMYPFRSFFPFPLFFPSLGGF